MARGVHAARRAAPSRSASAATAAASTRPGGVRCWRAQRPQALREGLTGCADTKLTSSSRATANACSGSRARRADSALRTAQLARGPGSAPRRLACGRRGAAAGLTRHADGGARAAARAARGRCRAVYGRRDGESKRRCQPVRGGATACTPHVAGQRADDRRAAGHACRLRRALLRGSARRAWRRCAPRSRLLGRPSCPWPPWPSRRRRLRERRRLTRQARRPTRRVRARPLRRRRAGSRRGERRNGWLRSHGHLP